MQLKGGQYFAHKSLFQKVNQRLLNCQCNHKSIACYEM